MSLGAGVVISELPNPFGRREIGHLLSLPQPTLANLTRPRPTLADVSRPQANRRLTNGAGVNGAFRILVGGQKSTKNKRKIAKHVKKSPKNIQKNQNMTQK